jgi:hypothetical protein
VFTLVVLAVAVPVYVKVSNSGKNTSILAPVSEQPKTEAVQTASETQEKISTVVELKAVDTAVQVVSDGISKFLEYRYQKDIDNNFGVTFGNASEVDKLTPAQKLVYMIAAAKHHPAETPWVRKQIASDLVWAGIAIFIISGITYSLSMLQKVAPETVAGFSNRFTGQVSIYDHTVWFKAVGKLVVLAILALPIIEAALELEQDISAGMAADSLAFLNLTSAAPGIYLFEGFAYSCCGWLFAFRLQYINLFVAHIVKIIIMYSLVWSYSEYFAILLTEWFASALAMRPIVLWYSALAVQHIATSTQNFDSLNGVSIFNDDGMYAKIAVDMVGTVTIDMTMVVIASFVTGVVFLLWPVLKLILKVVMNYLVGAIYKGVRMAAALSTLKNKARGVIP